MQSQLVEYKNIVKAGEKLRAELPRLQAREGGDKIRAGPRKGLTTDQAVAQCKKDIGENHTAAVQPVKRIRQKATAAAASQISQGTADARRSLQCIMDNASNGLRALDRVDEGAANLESIGQEAPAEESTDVQSSSTAPQLSCTWSFS